MAKKSGLNSSNPFIKSKAQAETVEYRVQKEFKGMMKDVPASEIPEGYCARNININDYSTYAEGRAGSRVYTTATMPVGTFNGKCCHQKAGVIIKVYGSTVYLCDKGMESFMPVLNISGIALTGICKIVEYNNDALLFNTAGIFLIVLSDYFPYMRKMNEPLPASLIVDQPEQFGSSGTSVTPYGYNYTYSMLQKSGNVTGQWDRLTAGFSPVFESGTCQTNAAGKDFGQCYFENETGLPVGRGPFELSPETFYNIIKGLAVSDGVYDVTHFGIYRTLNIGQNSSPAGSGISADSLGNNAALMVWCADIPVAKAFMASMSDGVVTATQGVFSDEDVGSVLSWGEGEISRTIISYTSPTQVTLNNIGGSFTSEPVVIGNGRALLVSQNGYTVNNTGTNGFLPTDVGKPIFLADGRIIWCSAYVSAYQMQTSFAQDIPAQAATMCPSPGNGNFTRAYRDMQIDNEPQQGTGEVGLKDRIASGASLYYPKRFYSPLPSGEIGCIDKGFLYTATRDDTTWYYSDIGDKKYCCGYYRADDQSEKVETHIKQLLVLNGVLAIIMASKTRTASPGVAADIGNSQIGESVFLIPSSQMCDAAVGVIAWQSIVFKGAGLIYAITNEPAVKTFDGTAWSATNLAKDCVQKYIQSVDLGERIVAVYVPGKYGGYKVWFKNWELNNPSTDINL